MKLVGYVVDISRTITRILNLLVKKKIRFGRLERSCKEKRDATFEHSGAILR